MNANAASGYDYAGPLAGANDHMESLCHSFPSLRGAPGAAPWDPTRFARWASEPISNGERYAAQFVLGVWDNGCRTDAANPPWWNEGDYAVGVFDAVLAVATWDDTHCNAFLAWCENPFFP